MNKTRTEIKVGLFVLVGLVLAALLILQFNKAAGPLTKTYNMELQATNVAGVYVGSAVSMAGVKIGTVRDIELISMDGKTLIHVQLYTKFGVRTNSEFVIRQSGFLGDQYIAVMQGTNITEVFKDGDVAPCQPSFDFGEAAKTATGLIVQVTGIVGQLSNAVQRVDSTLLAQETLTNLTRTVANLRSVSERALDSVHKIDRLLETNGPSISASVKNAEVFTSHLNDLAGELKGTLATNRIQLTASLGNIELATARLDTTVSNLNAGKGTVGALLNDDQISINLANTISNLSVFSSNMNNKGLLGVLRKPKAPAKSDK
jgi:phospholipid/cholesterol/gamma-HCH transport system substrate-binding protein